MGKLRGVAEFSSKRRATRAESIPPNTAWLQGRVALDQNGFVKTGADLRDDDLARWPLARAPYLLETRAPGVLAVGGVRSGSTKRVAAAVGEGSASIQLVHRILAE